jgi:hypothetical protein
MNIVMFRQRGRLFDGLLDMPFFTTPDDTSDRG